MYERDKHELEGRLRVFRGTMLKKKAFKAFNQNYTQNLAIMHKIMSNTQVIKRQGQVGQFLDSMKQFKEDRLP